MDMGSIASDNEETWVGQLPPDADVEPARVRRIDELTMCERLERVHALCAQMALLEPIVKEADGS